MGAGGGSLTARASCHHVRAVRARFTLTPLAYRRVTHAALASLVLIVFTGAAVRLTGCSGLGCPDWPKCGGGYVAPLETHAVIEFGNRVFSGIVAVAAVAAGLLAWRRRPFRRDLALLGALLPLGVVGQAVLGGLTVGVRAGAGFVMAHFALSMLVLVAAVALAWRATLRPATVRGAATAPRCGRCAACSARRADHLRRDRGHRRGATRAAREPATSSRACTSRAPGRSTGPSTSTRAWPWSSGWRRSRYGCSCAAASPTRRPGERSAL